MWHVLKNMYTWKYLQNFEHSHAGFHEQSASQSIPDDSWDENAYIEKRIYLASHDVHQNLKQSSWTCLKKKVLPQGRPADICSSAGSNMELSSLPLDVSGIRHKPVFWNHFAEDEMGIIRMVWVGRVCSAVVSVWLEMPWIIPFRML